MGAQCCGEEQRRNTLIEHNQEKYTNLSFVQYDDAQAQQNLKKYANHSPTSSYAVRLKGRKKPKLYNSVDASLKSELALKQIQQEQTEAVQLPVYYLKAFNAYYEGSWKNKKPHGLGKLYFTNGAFFYGPFKNGQIQGKDGIYIYPDGSLKRGQVLNGKLEGKGKFISQSGDFRYEGFWRADIPNGKGKEHYKDGSYYEGQFQNGLKHGDNCKYVWPNGKEYVGSFRNGYIDGQGQMKMNSGKGHYEGQFSRNLRMNVGRMVTETGVYQGQFLDGLMHGNGKFIWNDKKIYEGQFERGQLHGKGQITFPNGQVVKGNWHNGQNIGMSSIAHA